MNRLIFLFLGLLLIAPGQVNAQAPVTIKFNCAANDALEIETLRFYVTNIQLKLKDNQTFSENSSYHLVDIHDEESLTIKLNSVDASDIEAIQFCIGTDSITNVSGILDGDLDPIKGMYWAWNSGYINFKLEGEYVAIADSETIELHIGGYNGVQSTIQSLYFDIKERVNQPIIIDINPTFLVEQLYLETHKEVLVPGKKAVEIASLLPTIFTLRE